MLVPRQDSLRRFWKTIANTVTKALRINTGWEPDETVMGNRISVLTLETHSSPETDSHSRGHDCSLASRGWENDLKALETCKTIGSATGKQLQQPTIVRTTTENCRNAEMVRKCEL